MSDKESSSRAVEDTVCGIWMFKPKWLQILSSKKVYVLVYGLLGLNQFMLSAYFNGTLTTIEKRFQFSSQTSGIISSSWDFFALISFLLTSHLAGKGHRTRWLAVGSMLVGISCFIRFLPHVIYGPGEEILQYTVEYESHVNSTSFLGNITRQKDKICDDQPSLPEDCQNEELWNMPAFLFSIGHALLGLGGSLYWTCGAAYLDDNVRKNAVPVLLAIVQCIRMTGPMIGYMISAYTLTKFIEPTLTPTITDTDPRWIGAWWMGWVPIGISCLLVATIMLLFPRTLPRAAGRKKEQLKEKDEYILTDFKTSMQRILTNKILVYNSISSSFYMLGVIGYWTFMPKYIETQFRQTAATSNFMSGTIGILSSGLGIVISGAVISKFKPSPRTLSMANLVFEGMEVLGNLAYVTLGCIPDDLHGQWNDDKTWNLTMECNAGCNCEQSMSYNPICSFDQSTTFYSPCFAGCAQTIINDAVKSYSNCTCIGGPGTATEGVCPVDCGYNFIIFLSLMGIMRFLSSAGRSGSTIIQFRCVKEEDKSLSLGFSEVIMALIAFMPGPVLYGTIVDATCIVWGGKCGNDGNCWLYDGKRMNYYLNFTSAGFLVIGTLLDIGVWYHVKDLKIYDDDENEGGKSLPVNANSNTDVKTNGSVELTKISNP
ncbi:Organic anion transporter polypeptide OATP,Kazal domain,Major facilitator superfamily domain [Cinara cedri]|uniref:Solute carrier organic anion transporter family member n=1 Tax=Cinara cedri TaxID=506608 RepID=A0A5E4N855_9HEMI|nr:Organic anion transporter polypeptide OATP,Kazal domain,Major facilitator superfamily domain [Cinara cedri]